MNNKIRIKKLQKNDYLFSNMVNRSLKLFERFDENEFCDINDILELYNAKKNLEIEGNFEKIINKINVDEIVKIYFLKIDNNNVEDSYKEIYCEYIEDYWELFHKYSVYKKIKKDNFKKIFGKKELEIILKYKSIVKKFEKEILELINENNESVNLIIKKNIYGNKLYFPRLLQEINFNDFFNKKIETNEINNSNIDIIINSKINLSEELIYKLKKKREDFLNDMKHVEILYEQIIEYKNIESTSKIEKISEDKIKLIYNSKWLEENLDYPTILNNFIFVFEFVDLQRRCSFSKNNNIILSLVEFVKDDLKSKYTLSELFSVFYHIMLKYYYFLKGKNIYLEDVFNYFFNQYIPEEFNIDVFNININYFDLSYLNKIKLLLPELERVLKQFIFLVEKKDNVEEFLEISSKPFKYKEIPSFIEKKYAYLKKGKKKNLREKFIYIHKNMIGKKIIELKLDEKNIFEELLKEYLLNIDGEEKIYSTNKYNFLKDIFEKGFVSYGNFYKKKFNEYNKIEKEYLDFNSTLFSEQESQLFNYFLNKAEYLNGYDIRNRYLHGAYSKDEKVHEFDYIILLILFVIVIIKINEELCYYYDRFKNIKS